MTEILRPCDYARFGCVEPADPGCHFCPRHRLHEEGIGVKRGRPAELGRRVYTAAERERRSRRSTKFSRKVLKRSNGQCEACLLEDYARCGGVATEAHHIFPISSGLEWGWSRSLLFDATLNGLAVSSSHHKHIHSGETIRMNRLGLLATYPGNHPNRMLMPDPFGDIEVSS